jgi:hypothetical protein
MVVYEAARAICNLRNVTAQELFPAVSGVFSLVQGVLDLNSFLISSKKKRASKLMI